MELLVLRVQEGLSQDGDRRRLGVSETSRRRRSQAPYEKLRSLPQGEVG